MTHIDRSDQFLAKSPLPDCLHGKRVLLRFKREFAFRAELFDGLDNIFRSLQSTDTVQVRRQGTESLVDILVRMTRSQIRTGQGLDILAGNLAASPAESIVVFELSASIVMLQENICSRQIQATLLQKSEGAAEQLH